MKHNNLVTAPQVMDFEPLFKRWSELYAGGRNTFYRFMTTPSVEREQFMARCNVKYEFVGVLLYVTVGV